MSAPTPILYAHPSSQVGGANKVLLTLLDRLDRSRFAPTSVIPVRGPIEDDLARLNVPYVVHDLRSNRFRFWTVPSLLRFRAAHWLLHPAIIHANEPVYRMASVCGGSSLRVCHLQHPDMSGDDLKWLFTRRPDVVVTASAFVKEYIEAALGTAPVSVDIKVIPNPIDVDWFRPETDRAGVRRRLGFDANKFHLVIIGALSPHKGHAVFLRMAKTLLRQHPHCQFHIVGGDLGRDGTHRRSLEALVMDLDIARHVKFWGFLPDADVRDVLAASDLFVLPTTEEGFCLVVAEAQACEVPVIASAIRPLDEVVDDGRTGVLVEPTDHVKWAEVAGRLLSNSEERVAMGTAGRSWVIQRFSATAHVKAMQDLYLRLNEKRSVNRGDGQQHG